MKRLLLILPLVAACTRIDVGHAGIVVHRYGTNRGVDAYPLVTGTVWYNPFTTDVLQYPTFVQTAIWTQNPNEGDGPTDNDEIQFNSKEGLVIHADVSLSYQLDAAKVPAFYVKFRNDDLRSFTHGYLRNIARDAFAEVASTYAAEDLYGPKKEDFLKAVRSRINTGTQAIGIEIQQFGFIGAPRLPDNVVAALNAKIQAVQDAQRAQNQVALAEANARQMVAKAEGEAAANRALTNSLSPQLLEWRRLDLQERAIARWNGIMPQFMGSGTTPLLTLPGSPK